MKDTEFINSNRHNTREEEQNYHYYRKIREFDVKQTLKRISNGKTVGPNNIPIEVWNGLGVFQWDYEVWV